MADTGEREYMDYDVVIVGAGPAGLAAAIRLKQLAALHGHDVSVCVVEKGSEVGAHILSGAVLDPVALDELIPDWREKDAPVKTAVSRDRVLFLNSASHFVIPQFLLPPLMHNHGNYIISLANLCRWLAKQAEALGVEIYPGFAAAGLIDDEKGRIRGVTIGDLGVGRNGEKKDTFQPGIGLRAKYTMIAEGVRGSLAKQLIRRFDLSKGREPQKFGIGIKELWEVPAANHQLGLVEHTVGWPLDDRTSGGGFIYHLDNNQIAIGLVVPLNYENPHLSPFDEFQRFKTHYRVRPHLEGGKRVAYGARAITQGGFQSVPKLVFPGGLLIGCSAGFVNVPRIKGSHNAMSSGMLAAEAAFAALRDGSEGSDELDSYQFAYEESRIAKELKLVRNAKPLLNRLGTLLGAAFGVADMWMRTFGIGLPFTLKHGKPDYQSLKPAAACPPINYPKPDGVISFDKLSSVFISNTNHEEDQPIHLRLVDPTVPIRVNLPAFDEPAQRYCPAGVYEVVRAVGEAPRFQINAQNCVHCKTCDIKDPAQNIEWAVPEGGGGPNYPNM
ncbi:MAG: electron transfer flavoprotein-ubiquinone oxidoreductase [Alphaproteobacteria bacterium]|nr:electron transfer flavoprotein-ubiquinone oxidoreductase [Alphaproteobacteria bacterium]